jgi:hypothetical protein
VEQIEMKKLLIVLLPSLLLGQTAIYRSVQPGNTSAIAIGTGNNLTISGTTATFASALPDSVGVGCAIQYDDDNDGDIDADDSICFIHERTSSTVFTVANAAGGTPTATAAADQDWSIFHAYTTLANSESGTENTGIDADLRAFDAGNRDLDTNSEQWNISCYKGSDTGVTNWAGWTTSATEYIKIYTPYLTTQVGTRQRHLGIWTTNAYRMTLSTGGIGTWGIQADSPARHVRIEGLQFQIVAGASGPSGAIFLVASGGANIGYVSYCIIRGAAGGTTNGDFHAAFFGGVGSSFYRIYNNIIYDFITPSTTNDFGIRGGSSTPASTYYVYNNTVYGSAVGIFDEGANAVVVAKNNICDGNTTDFSGTGDSGCEYNASSDATAPGTNSRASQTFTYLNEAGDDFHLAAADGGAEGFGLNLSADADLAFSDDIDNDARGTTWSIGADHGMGSIIPTFVQRWRRRIIWWQ